MTAVRLPYFLSLPSAPPPWPGVVVIHEGNGMSQQLLRFCERLAGEGFAAIAPDLFFRVGGPGGADIPTMMGSLDDDRTTGDLEAAAGELRALGAGRVGVTGFCMGGRWAWRMAGTGTFAAAAGFYGAGIADDLHRRPRCPTQLFFGDRDPWVAVAEIERITAVHPETVVYGGAGHGFMRDGSDDFDEAAAGDAWRRLLAHFGEHLR